MSKSLLPSEYQEQFTTPLLQWFDISGRKDLPWQQSRTAYRIWISEIMLQQTQVITVIPYFERFMAALPELPTLATAHEEQVLALWSGLGYYSRARHIYQTAQIIHYDYQGLWPQTVEELAKLPGIGRSTAGAIAAQAFNQATAILDANVKRVLCRYFKIHGYPEDSAVKRKLWELAELCMATERCADYTQAIMDLGATCCTSRNPLCSTCPLQTNCLAFQEDCVLSLPQKKIKKIIPTKEQQFLLIHNQDKQVYLEKNPPEGLWGSLWCLPRLETQDSPLDYLKLLGPLTLHAPARELMRFKHTFSHFHLNIQVLILSIKAISSLKRPQSTGLWFSIEEIQRLGVPKPVQHIIQAFESTSVR